MNKRNIFTRFVARIKAKHILRNKITEPPVVLQPLRKMPQPPVVLPPLMKATGRPSIPAPTPAELEEMEMFGE